jgi:sugar lactone lactonase YvrE
MHEVFAVNHNGRESIEIFDLDVSKAIPRLTWKGCVIAPRAMTPNSVAPLPSGGFVATSFGIRTDPKTYEKALAGEISGFVAEWSPTAGWSEVPGTLLVANNGVAVSKDGKQLFVTTWGDRKLHVLSRGEIPHTHQTIDLPGVRPDNVRLLADGKLLIAGQSAEPNVVFACLSQPVCTVEFKVLRFDPATSILEPLLDEPGSPVFGGASAAILVGDEIWVGTFRGNRVARYKLRP